MDLRACDKQNLSPYVDMSEARFVVLLVSREHLNKRYGSALKALNAFLSEHKSSTPSGSVTTAWSLETEERDSPVSGSDLVQQAHRFRSTLYQLLDWQSWQRQQNQWNLVRFPSEYAPF